ncbi:MAG: M48 family metalloprotease [Deltaproteobacteria bacterium]|nr:M48 family metalloprotease [Deltaproteobacteria bacterium]MBW2418494.1 M48 family metalloprotease [Deltaproteobacteria bacterium]
MVFGSIFGSTIGCSGGGSRPPQEKQRQVLLSTEYDDVRLGDEASKQIEAEMGIFDDPELTTYVEDIGKRLLRYAPERPFDYTFQIVDQATPNAFALPGGHIYVSRGLVGLANSEDELACVIGHEITHAAERHSAGRQAHSRRLNPLAMGYMRAMAIASYGREHERDADRGGQVLAAQAGYDPIGMSTFLQSLNAIERFDIGWSRLPSFFATHPGTSERSASTQDRANAMSWTPQPPIAANHDEFLARLDGLVWGPNPAEGVFQGSRFLHPDLNFGFTFPEGWTTLNSHQAVVATSPDRDAQISLSLAGPGHDPEKAAEEYIDTRLKEMQGKVKRGQPIRIGTLPAYRVEAEGRGQGGSLSAHLTFIAYDGLVYLISALTPSSLKKKYVGRASNVARSFHSLTLDERESVGILRLRLVAAEEGDTIEGLSRRYAAGVSPNLVAVVNALYVDQPLAEGQLVKVAVAEPYVPAPKPKPGEEEVEKAEKKEGAERGSKSTQTPM